MSDLASRLIYAMERLDTRSAAVLRRASYATLEEFGIDVGRLVDEARAAIRAERKADLERSQATDERLAAWARRIPELSAAVQGGPISEARELLAETVEVDGIEVRKHSITEIAKQVGCKRSFVANVRDLDIARRAKARLGKTRKGKTRKLMERLAQFVDRAPWTSAPTKERKRHLGEGEEFATTKTVGEQEHHSTRWAVDQIRGILAPHEYDATCRVRDAHNGRRLDTLSKPGPATDKLALTPEQEYWGRVWNGIWPHVPAGLRPIVLNFVCEKAWTGEERTMSFVEFGRAYGRVASEDQARGIAHGAVKAACAVLAHISKDYDGLVKAERLRAYRAMDKQRDVHAYIADAGNLIAGGRDGEASERAAVGLMCKRFPSIKPWAIRSCVRAAIKAVVAEREERTKQSEMAA